MTELASPGQLRASFLRWSLFIVPLVLFLGFFSGQLAGSGPGNTWFDDLVKPSIYPPPALFGIVWSILYVMIGFALVLVIIARGAPGRGAAIAAFVVQLALNLAWSPLFFGMHQMQAALILLVVLVLAIVVTIVLFRKVRPMAAALLLPYLAWCLFATLLNWQFLEANPGGQPPLVDVAANI
jgi:tryptophan-rich sensory protein